MNIMDYKGINKMIGNNIRHYLSDFQMTQAELADRLDVGTTSVSNWVNGYKAPRMDKIDAMCKIFNCCRSDLLDHPGAFMDSLPLEQFERDLISKVRELNKEGADALFAYVDFLLTQDQYQKKTQKSSLSVG